MAVFKLALSALLMFSSVAVAQSRRDVDISTNDGVTLRGTYYSPGRAGPAVLLLHQCNSDRGAWQPLATAFAAAGLHVLAVDLRGFGQSGGKPTDDAGRSGLAAKWPADIDTMLTFLMAQTGVDKARLGAGGASCGVPQATALATRHRDIKALFVLSGPANDDATRYIARTPGLAVLGVAGLQDGGAIDGVRQLVQASPNPASTLKSYPGPEHGVELFQKHPDLIPQITRWFRTQLGVSARPVGDFARASGARF